MSYDNNVMSIMDISTSNEVPEQGNGLNSYDAITFENAITTVIDNHREATNLLTEISRVESEMIAFQAGDVKTIHLDEELTLELSISDLATLSYSKLSKDKDELINKAFEYIKSLINKVIIMIKKAFTKYLAVHSKHISMSSDYLEVLNGVDLSEVPNDNNLDIARRLGGVIDKTNNLSMETLHFINGDIVINKVTEKLQEYGNYISIIRPPDKIILNTVSTEMGSARADIMKEWDKNATAKFIELFVNEPVSLTLNDNIKYSVIASDVDVNLKDTTTYSPFTTDGILLTCLYRTPEHQIRLMRTEMKSLPHVSMVNMTNLRAIIASISKTDLGALVKADIRRLETIERDAKTYFKQLKDELGTDSGKRNSSFNNMVTMVNAALTISNNRMKLTNNLISVTDDIVNRLGLEKDK